MKKICCIILALAMIFCLAAAHAQVPKLGERMFKLAKNSLACLASGDYDKIVTSVPFSGVSPSADEWRNLAEAGFTSLGNGKPQETYAVAFWTGDFWKIAVPVQAPSNAGVEALVLVSEDGSTFTGYGCSTWGRIEKEYRRAEYLQWNEEYNPSTSVIIESDVE